MIDREQAQAWSIEKYGYVRTESVDGYLAGVAAERERQSREVMRLREALVKVIAHCGRFPEANRELLNGLLGSCERIARAALGESTNG